MENYLDIMAWHASDNAEPIVLDVLTTPRSLYEAMRRATALHNPSVNSEVMSASMQGIHELFSHASKDVILVKNSAWEARVPRQLRVYCLPGTECSEELARAFQRWLDIRYPGVPPHIVSEAYDQIQSRSNKCWERHQFEPGKPQRPDDVCGTPGNSEYFDVLAAFAAERLSRSTVTFGSGEQKALIRQIGGGYRYQGHELVVWPPKEHVAPASDGGEPRRSWYTEVLTITTSTHPEQRARGVHLIARTSIRNWGEVNSKHRPNDRQRSMDCFFGSQSSNGDAAPELHTALGYMATSDNPDESEWQGTPEYPIQPKWGWNHQGRHEVLEAVLGWQGVPTLLQHNARGYLVSRLLGNGSIGVFHRLWHGGRDRWLSGGTGVPWRDRRDLAHSIDVGMRQIGFQRVPQMRRERSRSPAKGVFYDQGGADDRRGALAKALTAQTGVPHLQIIVARANDTTGEEILNAIADVLGEPLVDGPHKELRWPKEDLLIKLTEVPSGPFNPPVSNRRLPKEERNRRWTEQSRAMREHLSAVESPFKARCAIIERAEALMNSWEDPHFRAKTAAAEVGVIPQGLIARPQAHESRTHSVESAVRDCFRMLGVVPLHSDYMRPATAAITTILHPTERSNNGKTCVATRVFGNVIECARVSPQGVLEWIPYAEFLLGLLKESSPNRWFPRKGDIASRLVGQFIQRVMDDCQSHDGRVLLLMDMDGLARFVPALQNKYLQFDRLRLGATVMDAATYDNVAVVRHLDGSPKVPQYHPNVGGDDDSITAGASGCFRWKENVRTLYSIKSMPQTAMSSVMATKNSRHAGKPQRSDAADRAAADFDEMCLFMKPAGCDPMEVLVRTSRLKGAHVQYPGHTQVPFPLHEARALGRR